MGWVDSYRRAFDIISPVSGEVIGINATLVQHPAHINAYPYSRGGVLKVRVNSLVEYDEMLRFEAYTDLIRRLQQYDEWTKDRRMT
jgi:glycine cleavage system H protein